MKTIAIVGFGRFGKTLYRLIKDDFAIILYSRSQIKKNTSFSQNTKIVKNVPDIYQANTIFYCVPINEFEDVIKSHKQYIKKDHLLIDVLSVKKHAQKVFQKYLTPKTQAILTHPMFGPDSSKNGFHALPIILDRFTSHDNTYKFWKEYFSKKGLRIVEMSAEEHDRLAATSQGLTHFIGRLLEAYNFKETSIDSLGAKKLHEVVSQTCNDTWQLFHDLQHFNPHTQNMRIKLGEVYDNLYNKLLPKQVEPGLVTFGIQGGKGSFNEEAILYYLKRSGIKKYKIKYLYTTVNVLQALHSGEIDRGQFAIHNSVGGIVNESIEAMARYKFKIIDQFAIKIAHALMIRKDSQYKEITTIVTHPQVLAQCKNSLSQKYPHLKKTSGEGELIDHAMVARQLGDKKLPKYIAVMGSKILAGLYNLTVVEDNLQDAQENYTSFLQVERT